MKKTNFINPFYLLILSIILSFLLLLHSLLSYYTLACLFSLVLFIFLIIFLTVRKFLEKGFLAYCSQSLQNTLLNRSIFDVLCDLWFMPKIGLYIKAFFGPFYYQVNPEQALSNFEIIGLSRAVTVKGMINLFPCLKKLLMPRKKKALPFEKNRDFMNDSDDDITHDEVNQNENIQIRTSFENSNRNSVSVVQIKTNIIFRTENFKQENIPLIIRETRKPEKEEKSIKKSSIPSDLKVPIFKNFYEEESKVPEKIMEVENDQTISEISNEKKKKTMKNNYPLEMDMKDMDMPKTKLIKSSRRYAEQEERKRNELAKVPISTKWDNYEKFEQKKLLEKNQIEKGVNPLIPEMKGPLKYMTLLNDLKTNGILSKIESGKLIKLFGISSIVLLAQLRFNQNIRQWIKKTIVFLLYLIPTGISITSFILIFAKSLKNKERKKEINPSKEEENLIKNI